MNRSVITLGGLDILNNSLANGDTSQYWIGYYGLAYIPEEERGAELDRNINKLVPDDVSGDELYNIFQGSMADVVAGFDEGDVDNAENLYNQCLYADNIESTFRYSLQKDSDGNTVNTLVTFEQDASNPSKYSHFMTYYGVGGDIPSDVSDAVQSIDGLPIPAPLFYAKDSEVDAYAVTPDMRNYSGKTGNPGWSSSNQETRSGDTYANHDDKMSISTFNRYHAPSSSEGYAVAHEPACRNMTKVTKYFPIDHYDLSTIIRDGGHIQNIETGKSSTSLMGAKVGTVKYKICLNIADYMKKTALRANMADADDAATTADNLANPIGFKFNRIGLYAVPVTLHAFNVLSLDSEKCGGNKVQIEVNGDDDPILFAVIDTDTIEMREDGLAKFEIDFSVVFQENTALVNNPVIYYNLYENDSITWYKNQLIANASTMEAVTSLGVEMQYLRTMVESLKASSSQCGRGDDGDALRMQYYSNQMHGGSSSPNLIDLGYICHDDSYIDSGTGSKVQDHDIDDNPDSDEFIEKIDLILSEGAVPFIMYRCNEYLQLPTEESTGEEHVVDTPDIDVNHGCDNHHCKTGISHTNTAIRFAPLVRIQYCSYYFANPVDHGWVIRLHEGEKVQFVKSDNWLIR